MNLDLLQITALLFYPEDKYVIFGSQTLTGYNI